MAPFQWTKNPTPLSEISPAFTLPAEMRPQLSDPSTLGSVPVIDLRQEEGPLVEQVLRACEEYGFFQVIHHGIPQELCAGVLDAIRELFELPPPVKAEMYSDDPKKKVRLYSRYLKVPGSSQEKKWLWSEGFFHPWHPSQDFTALLPDTLPTSYRALIGEYATEISKLFTRLLTLVCLGLGLDKDYLEAKHGQSPRRMALANYYPPCPNPQVALGFFGHTDFNTLTILQQSDRGLQVVKDGKWVSVDPIPAAFVVNVGDQLQVMSNGRYKSVHHRAVTNKHRLRVSIAFFFGPDQEATVGPVEDLVTEERPPVYRSYRYAEFLEELSRQDGIVKRVKEAFQLQQ